MVPYYFPRFLTAPTSLTTQISIFIFSYESVPTMNENLYYLLSRSVASASTDVFILLSAEQNFCKLANKLQKCCSTFAIKCNQHFFLRWSHLAGCISKSWLQGNSLRLTFGQSALTIRSSLATSHTLTTHSFFLLSHIFRNPNFWKEATAKWKNFSAPCSFFPTQGYHDLLLSQHRKKQNDQMKEKVLCKAVNLHQNVKLFAVKNSTPYWLSVCFFYAFGKAQQSD